MCLAAQNCQKTPTLAFKVIQGRWIQSQSRAMIKCEVRGVRKAKCEQACKEFVRKMR